MQMICPHCQGPIELLDLHSREIVCLVQAYGSSLVFATYPGPLEFMGQRRLSGTLYVSLKWQRDPAVAGSCPLIIHLPAGDASQEQLATQGELRNLGMQEVPYPPMPPEAAALVGPNGDPNIPKVIRFGLGDFRVATQHTAGKLTGVWVWVVEPGHETPAWRPHGTRYSISVRGQWITLPLTEAELVRTLGLPQGRRKDY